MIPVFGRKWDQDKSICPTLVDSGGLSRFRKKPIAAGVSEIIYPGTGGVATWLVIYERTSNIARPIPFAGDVNKLIFCLPNFRAKVLNFVAPTNTQTMAMESLD